MMRTVGFDPDDETFKHADWKDGPDVVLEAIDRLLAPHGLEVVVADSQSGTYHFQIGPQAWRPISECPPDARKIIGWCLFGFDQGEARECQRYVTSASTGGWRAHGCSQRLTHFKPWPADAPAA
ncbi:hypothetical protein [Methylorubrum thiocyanatum]|uniref:hypothetical protein n=1 Tax=Methylorubrum thiocyanatum TaxID=47958 RepID=UPI003666B209